MGDMTGLAAVAAIGMGALIGLLVTFGLLVVSIWFVIPAWAAVLPMAVGVAIGGFVGWRIER